MNYKVFIKQCRAARRAAAIAEEVAKRCGATPGQVWSAVTEGSICIKTNADQREAMSLKEQFEALGAEVEFVPETAEHAATLPYNEDDDDEATGRVLTEEEFMDRLQRRSDIFTMEKDDRIRNIEAACLVMGIASGVWMTKHELATVISPDFYDKTPKEISARVLSPQEIEVVLQPKRAEPKTVKVVHVSQTRTLKKQRSIGYGGTQRGGGDPRERVTKTGVLGLIAEKVVGKPTAGGDLFAQGGFQNGLDAILQGVGALKSGGGSGAGRSHVAGIGYNVGYGPGLGEQDGGIDDIMSSLMYDNCSSALALKVPAHKGDVLTIAAPHIVPGIGALTGGRSRGSIMRVVMQNLAALRYAYNKRLREKPGLKGKITCRFAIDELGKVVFCEMTGSTMDDALLEAEVVTKIRTWVFEKIDKPGDITEVVYPFAFSQ